MFRSLLALTVRSVREDSRSIRSHFFRLMFAGLIFVMLAYGQSQAALFGAPGLRFFENLCWLNFMFITVGAVSLFATPITEEKEEATLGLLRMAGISPLALLLGKSTTRLFAAALILAIQVPFTLLAITLGGVLWHQILAAYVGLLAYLVLVAQLGLLCSVACPRSSMASGLAGVLLFAFLVFPWWILEFCQSIQRSAAPGEFPTAMALAGLGEWTAQPLQDASIFPKLFEILSTGYAGDVISFQVWANLAGALALFLVAWATFDVFTRNHLTSVPARGALLHLRSLHPAQAFRRWLSPGRAWIASLVWKEFHFTTGGFPMIVGKFVGYFVAIVGIALFNAVMGAREGPLILFGRVAWILMLFLGGLELAILISRIFREELRWQTFSSLMMLPTTVARIAWAKVAACLLSWFPAVLWLAIGILIDSREAGWMLKEMLEEVPMLLFFWPLHYLVFLHMVAWLSLVLKWGGLPLSFVICYPLFVMLMGGCLTLIFAGGGGGDEAVNVVFGILCFVAMFLMAVLQAGIRQQLQLHAERG